MSTEALVIRHVAFEDLGLLGPVLARRGYRAAVLDAGEADPVAAVAALGTDDLVVVLGGPIGVGDVAAYPYLADEIRAIADAVGRGVPVLGICLGAQLIAAALGAEVAPTGRVEIGYAPLTLAAEARESVLAELDGHPVLHWHGDAFGIPEGAMRLAETPGFPNQAFALGPRVLGLQFHLEADPAHLERWLIGHAHELATHGIDLRELRRQAAEHGPALARRGTRVFERWLDGLAAVAEVGPGRTSTT